MPLWASTIIALLLLCFAVPGLSMALAIVGMLVLRVLEDVYKMRFQQFIGGVITLVVGGAFVSMFGYGAYEFGSQVIDGLIGRYIDYFTG